jgi:uncharacterized protein
MESQVRAVIDTGIIISATMLPRSLPRKAFDLASGQGRLLISAATLAEVDEVLRRPKFSKYAAEDERLEFLAALVREAEIVEITESITDCRDPKDNKFLELAVCGKAGYIISGDADLLVLHPFRGVSILTPRDFLEGGQRSTDSK